MSWMITYAVSSTVIALLVVVMEKRFRPEWREALLWLAILAPVLIASLALIEPAQSGHAGLTSLTPAITVSLPSDFQVPADQTPAAGTLVLLVWAGIALLMIVRDFVLHRRLVVALDRQAVIHDVLGKVASELGIRRHVKLTKSDSLPVPIAIGSREICVPSALLESAGPADLEPIFAHELAHLRRRDPQLQRIARVISVILWWQPLNRVVARKLAAVAELRADALCSSVVDPTRIARTLVLFAQQLHTPRVAGMPAFPAGLLTERVSHLLSDERAVSGIAARLAVSSMLVFGTAMIAPRFSILSAQIPAMFSPLVVKASQVAVAPSRNVTPLTPARLRRPAPTNAEPKDNDVIGALTILLNDPEKHVRSAARESLRGLGTSESLSALANDRFAQEDAMKEIR